MGWIHHVGTPVQRDNSSELCWPGLDEVADRTVVDGVSGCAVRPWQGANGASLRYLAASAAHYGANATWYTNGSSPPRAHPFTSRVMTRPASEAAKTVAYSALAVGSVVELKSIQTSLPGVLEQPSRSVIPGEKTT